VGKQLLPQLSEFLQASLSTEEGTMKLYEIVGFTFFRNFKLPRNLKINVNRPVLKHWNNDKA